MDSNMILITKTFRHIIKAVSSSILCIRFPFLYPRNRFTDTHYNNWNLIQKHKDLYSKYHVTNFEEGAYNKFCTGNSIENKSKYHLKQISEKGWVEYWTTWWAYPYVKFLDFIHNKVLQIFHCIPTYTELDAMPAGWRKAFGIQMCKEIKHALLRFGGRKVLHKYRISQIKEKWGCLCWYDNYSCTEVYKIIHKYEYISSRTCIKCGEPATGYTPYEYWKSPYCDDCRPKNSRFFFDFGLDVKIKDKNGVEHEHSTDGWYGWTGNINGRESNKEAEDNYIEYIKLHYNYDK